MDVFKKIPAMKTLRDLFLIVVLVMIGVLSYQKWFGAAPDFSEYEKTISLQNVKIDSLKLVLKNTGKHTDSIIKEIEVVRYIRDTVYQTIEAMPPDELVAEFDNLTGDGPSSKITEDSGVITQMPRIKEATIGLSERDYLKQENELLGKALASRGAELKIAKNIILKQQESINTRDEHIDTIRAELRAQRRRGKLWEYTTYTVSALLIYSLVN